MPAACGRLRHSATRRAQIGAALALLVLPRHFCRSLASLVPSGGVLAGHPQLHQQLVAPRLPAARALRATSSRAMSDPKRTDALVWVDCEMTGLGANGGPGDDVLLEVACLITDGDLNLVAEGPDLVIHHPDAVLDGMNAWCKDHFGWKGPDDVTPGLLADEVRKSTVSLEDADRQLLEFVSSHVEKGKGVLAGNTVHMDKRFLDKFAPKFMGHLHYRLVDVSTMKELCRRWYPEEFKAAPAKKAAHRALGDIRESLEELRYYRCAICKTGPADAEASGVGTGMSM